MHHHSCHTNFEYSTISMIEYTYVLTSRTMFVLSGISLVGLIVDKHAEECLPDTTFSAWPGEQVMYKLVLFIILTKL